MALFFFFFLSLFLYNKCSIEWVRERECKCVKWVTTISSWRWSSEFSDCREEPDHADMCGQCSHRFYCSLTLQSCLDIAVERKSVCMCVWAVSVVVSFSSTIALLLLTHTLIESVCVCVSCEREGPLQKITVFGVSPKGLPFFPFSETNYKQITTKHFQRRSVLCPLLSPYLISFNNVHGPFRPSLYPWWSTFVWLYSLILISFSILYVSCDSIHASIYMYMNHGFYICHYVYHAHAFFWSKLHWAQKRNPTRWFTQKPPSPPAKISNRSWCKNKSRGYNITPLLASVQLKTTKSATLLQDLISPVYNPNYSQ